MEPIFNEKMIRDELRRIDKKTGYNAADLPIKFGDAKSYLGKFIYGDNMSFYFSNYFFRDPNLALEEKLDTIRHEYAHYLDYMLHGFSSHHGSAWKQCCHIVGALPVRCFRKEYSDYYVAMHKKERLLNEQYDQYCIGQEIVHPVFGNGVLTDIIGEGLSRIACVAFNGVGTKEIAIEWIDTNCKRV